MKQLRRIATLVAAAVVVCLAAPYAAAAEEPAPKAAAPLDFVPSDAVWFMTVRVGDVWAHPAVKAWRAKMGEDKLSPFAISYRFGVEIGEIDRFTEFFRESGPLDALTMLKPYDREAVVSAPATYVASPNPDKVPGPKMNGRLIYSKNGSAVYFRDDRTFLVGSMANLVDAYVKTPAALPAEKKPEGPLTPALRLASEKHMVVVGMDVAAFAKTMRLKDNLPPEAKAVEPLLKARLATLTVDLDEKLRADFKVIFANEADAKEGTAAVDALLEMERGGTEYVIKEMTKEGASKQPALLKDIQVGLKAAKAEQKGDTVHVAAALKIDPEALTAALIESVPKVVEHPGNKRDSGNKPDLDK